MTRNHKGFTLAELLVVVSIIVVLAAAVLIGIDPLKQLLKGFDARRRSDLEKIKIALENYYADHECYPAFPKDSRNRPTYTCGSDILDPYLKIMPCDPNTQKPYLIYMTPEADACPQQFAVYATIYSFFDSSRNKISRCPNTIVVTSAGIKNTEIISGCAFTTPCFTTYGCKTGSCVIVADDGNDSPCDPSSCDADCGGSLFTDPKTGDTYTYCRTPEYDSDNNAIPGTYANECHTF